MLLAPRDYLSTFMKIGTILFLVVGVIVVNPTLQMPAFTQFVGGGGPIIPGHAVPLRVHHDRLRRDLRLPRADRLGHHAEDDRQGERHPPDRLRRDADRGPRRRHGADRGDGAASGRLLRHQHGAGRVPDARHARVVNLPDLQARGRRESSPGGRAAPCRSPSAWRRSSAGCPACAR